MTLLEWARNEADGDQYLEIKPHWRKVVKLAEVAERLSRGPNADEEQSCDGCRAWGQHSGPDCAKCLGTGLRASYIIRMIREAVSE